jgi:intracellular sulfur oxidation DsrE/DsrF family protein
MRVFTTVLIWILTTSFLLGQVNESEDGPEIYGYGEVWEIEDMDESLLDHDNFQLVFDIFSSSEDPANVNISLNTIARFINMHAQAGISIEDMDIVAVIHGTASYDVMDNSFYTSKNNTENPNIELIEKLIDSGVQFYICGQSMNARKLDQSDLLSDINIALSAMTAIHHFVKEGSVLIKF